MELQPGGFEPNPKHEQNIWGFCLYFANCLLLPIQPHTQKNLYFWGGQNCNPYFTSRAQPFN